MSFLAKIDSTGYEVLTALVIANVTAQIIKTIVFAMQHKKADLRMLFTTGGMPSSHSSSVVAMATTIGFLHGFESTIFALATTFAIVVMYDSAGVRRAAGKQAAVLNSILAELVSDTHHLSGAKLKELLGHSPKQVIVGGFLGFLVSYLLREAILSGVV
ncbi:MAG: divergent PAP2 family protein [Cyanobacteria bacterium]|nr:divergent PAP2 family protein [Cyanobacteriota bacterium]MDA1020271.1 divergent PAP2 family protein [Cyanobacteriota bacterium]